MRIRNTALKWRAARELLCNLQDGVLLSIDWLGLITEWRVGPGPNLRNVTRQGAFMVPRLLERRDVERLIDFNSEYLGKGLYF